MDFGTKLQMLRKQNGLSQEALADKLNVSRQAVSKWEAGGYPEMDKLIMISDLFDVSLDYLIKDQKDERSETEEKYFMNTQKIQQYMKYKKLFGFKIALSVMTIILSVMIPLLLEGTAHETMGTIIMLIIIAGCVAVLVMTGISNEQYEELEKKYIQKSYQDEQDLQARYVKFKSQFGMSIALGVFMIIVSVAGSAYVDEYLKNEKLSGIILLTSVAIAIFIFIVEGIRDSMYKFLIQNRKYIEEKEKSDNSLFHITMPLAAMIYFVMGFTNNWWHPGWLIFPITAIITGGIESVIKKS